MFCPRCKEIMTPVHSNDVIRLLGKICRILKSGEIAEVSPVEWLCDKCKVIWHIEPKGILADANQEIIEELFVIRRKHGREAEPDYIPNPVL